MLPSCMEEEFRDHDLLVSRHGVEEETAALRQAARVVKHNFKRSIRGGSSAKQRFIDRDRTVWALERFERVSEIRAAPKVASSLIAELLLSENMPTKDAGTSIPSTSLPEIKQGGPVLGEIDAHSGRATHTGPKRVRELRLVRDEIRTKERELQEARDAQARTQKRLDEVQAKLEHAVKHEGEMKELIGIAERVWTKRYRRMLLTYNVSVSGVILLLVVAWLHSL